MKRILALILLLPLASAFAHSLDDYNAVWTSPSTNSGNLMPCGAFDENNLFPKPGRLRVTLDPNSFADGGKFRQELKLREGHVEISGEKDGVSAKVTVWVDVFHPVAHVEVESVKSVGVVAACESWRLADRELTQPGTDACRSWRGAPEKAVVH